ncbi:hypothetical protein RB653_002353 [Dictyostelium firmibasis]|uniref:Transmembrane protein n=1 Tax=Dictyostelium firmibasis TaxID=79012 RepID=A0AAN7TNQ4_9MYCE
MKVQPFSQFLAQQGKIYWPFLVGGGAWALIIAKVHMGISEENKANSYYWKKVQAIRNPGSHSHGHGHH